MKQRIITGVAFLAICVSVLVCVELDRGGSAITNAVDRISSERLQPTQASTREVKVAINHDNEANQGITPDKVILSLEPTSALYEFIRSFEAKVPLTPAQSVIIASALSDADQLKNEVERSLMVQKGWDGTNLVFEIPSYAAKGEYIRSILYQKLMNNLPQEIFDKFDGEVGSRIDTVFSNFGASTQLITIKYDSSTGVFKLKRNMQAYDDKMGAAVFAPGAGDTYSVSSSLIFKRKDMESGYLSKYKQFIEKSFLMP